jgi:hypothetical protein
MRIWVDADACPAVIKDILYRAAERLKIPLTLVANKALRTPPSAYIRALQVPRGIDVADSHIVRELAAGDLVITADIPLAADVIAKGARALNPRGEFYSPENIQERLALRNYLDELRGTGERTGGPPVRGTGTLIGDRLVLSALHVVADRRFNPPSLFSGPIRLTFPTLETTATLIDGLWDTQADWVLLECEQSPPGAIPVPLGELTPHEKSHWETFGFPDLNPEPKLARDSVQFFQTAGGRPAAYDNDKFLLFHVNFGVPEEYEEAHLPDALYLDTNQLEDPADWNRRTDAEIEAALAGFGITADTTVVLYGRDTEGQANEKWPGRRAGQIAATRALMILRYAGVDDIRLLDGGYDWWVRAGNPLELIVREPNPVEAFGARLTGRAGTPDSVKIVLGAARPTEETVVGEVPVFVIVKRRRLEPPTAAGVKITDPLLATGFETPLITNA